MGDSRLVRTVWWICAVNVQDGTRDVGMYAGKVHYCTVPARRINLRSERGSISVLGIPHVDLSGGTTRHVLHTRSTADHQTSRMPIQHQSHSWGLEIPDGPHQTGDLAAPQWPRSKCAHATQHRRLTNEFRRGPLVGCWGSCISDATRPRSNEDLLPN